MDENELKKLNLPQNVFLTLPQIYNITVITRKNQNMVLCKLLTLIFYLFRIVGLGI